MKVGVMIRSFPPHPNPFPPDERGDHSYPSRAGGMLAYFNKIPHSSVPPRYGKIFLEVFL
jgi:hypothetical protein